MKLVRQPKNSNLCGQACVATLAGISLRDSIDIFRTKGRTTTKKVRQALRQMGIGSSPRLKRGFPKCPTAILKFVHPDGNAHWVVWHQNKYYDPVAGVFKKPPKYLSESRITSHLPINLCSLREPE